MLAPSPDEGLSNLECVEMTTDQILGQPTAQHEQRAEDNYVLLNEGPAGGNGLLQKIRSIQMPEKKFLIIAALACSAIALVVVLIANSGQSSSGKHSPEQITCHDTMCSRQALSMLEYMNATANPCNDFYEYACGGFKPPPVSTRSLYNVFNAISENGRKQIASKLVKLQSEDSTRVERKGSDFFVSCINAPMKLKQSASELVKVINDMGGLQLLGTWKPQKWNISTIMLDMWKKHNTDTFFTLKLLGEEADSPIQIDHVDLRYLAEIKGDRSQMQNMMYILDDFSDFNEQDQCIENRTCLQQFVADAKSVASAIDLELQKITKRRSPAHHTLSELQSSADAFNWTLILDGMIDGVSLSQRTIIYKTDEVNIINELIKSLDARKLQSYMMWRFVHKYRIVLGRKHLYGKQDHTRQDICLELFEDYMPQLMVALGKSLLDSESLEAAKDLLNEAIYTEGRVPQHMATISRKIFSKPSSLTSREVEIITYDANFLNDFYQDVKQNVNSFFNNLEALNQLARKREVGNHRQTNIEGEWSNIDPNDVAVELHQEKNTIHVPYGVASAPLFYASNPSKLNIPGIVSIIYRELAKLILSTTELAKGSPEGIAHGYRQCVEDLFHDYLVKLKTREQPLLNLIGTSVPKSMDHDISLSYLHAEMLSLQLSFELFQSTRLKTAGLLPRFHMLPLEEDDLFFLSFAQTRCQYSEDNLEGIADQWLTFPHRVMINRFMEVNPNFQTAYGCQPRHPSKPRNQCDFDEVAKPVGEVRVQVM